MYVCVTSSLGLNCYKLIVASVCITIKADRIKEYLEFCKKLLKISIFGPEINTIIYLC